MALITANVLRLRREWALAEAKCSEVLRLDPQNATAHSLMGDILRDQGRTDDAIEWYKLALDLNPGSDADRKKLETLIDQVFVERPRGARRALAAVFGRLAKATTADVRASRPICPWATVAAVILGMVMLAAFTAVLIGRHAPPPVAAPTDAGSTGAFAPPEPGVDEGSVQPTVQPVAPPELTGDITALEHSVLGQVKQQAAVSDPNCRVAGVEIYPKEAAVLVRIIMPELWVPRDQRASLLRAAAVAAVAAATYDTRIAAVKVRATTRSSTGAEQVALVADGSAETIRAAAQTEAAKQPLALFHTTWWREGLAEESGGTAAGER